MANDQTKDTTKVSKMSKSAIWKQVEELIKVHKIKPKAAEALAMLLSPKAGGGTSQHPPKLDDKGNIVEAWCKYHECYEPVGNMVMSNDKTKGYCKAAASKSNRLRKESKELDSKVIVLMSDGKFEEAQKLATEAKELSKNLNSPSLYNLKEDWEEFNKVPAKPSEPKETK